MNGKYFHMIRGLLFVLIMTACRGVTSSNIAETPCIPQTVEVTRIVQHSAIAPEFDTTTASKETVVPSTSLIVHAGASSIELNPAYFDGVIVLLQYYTFLDDGLYEEVLPLYSTLLFRKTGGKNFEADLKSVKLNFIRPYDYWCILSGWPLQPISENEIRYIVGTTVFHKAPAWNVRGTPQPDNRTSFVSLVLENDQWKLNELNSSPWFP